MPRFLMFTTMHDFYMFLATARQGHEPIATRASSTANSFSLQVLAGKDDNDQLWNILRDTYPYSHNSHANTGVREKHNSEFHNFHILRMSIFSECPKPQHV